MEKHPIPRDVTGFQFKLIGDMTVKQFAYLATGSITGYILISLPIIAFVKIPIACLFVITGIILAFMPVSGRPVDTMLYLFIKALFAANQYVFQKSDHSVSQSFITKLADKPKSDLDKKEESYTQSVVPIVMPKPTSVTDSKSPTGQTPAIPETPQEEEKVLDEESSELKKEIEEAKKTESTTHDPKELEQARLREVELEKKLNQVLSQKQELEKQIILLSEKLKANPQNIYAPREAIRPLSPNVGKIPTNKSSVGSIPTRSEFANVIKGIVKDPRGNVLSNILVEVRDKEDNPVRAFKTNNMGRFASATPLLDGTYTVHFEDPNEKNDFETAEITASGQEIPPLEIFSTDAREKLRKELFG